MQDWPGGVLMRLSTKSDYASRAVAELALHYGAGRALHIEEIARGQGIPQNYLVQILIELKGKGLVRSKRGKAGGYTLARPPAEITFGDVLRAIDGDVLQGLCLSDAECAMLGRCGLRSVYLRMRDALSEIADQTTFDQIVMNMHQQAPMFYI